MSRKPDFPEADRPEREEKPLTPQEEHDQIENSMKELDLEERDPATTDERRIEIEKEMKTLEAKMLTVARKMGLGDADSGRDSNS